MEWHDPRAGCGWFHIKVGHSTAAKYVDDLKIWTHPGYSVIATCMRRPARIVPADLADLDPASRGPIGEE